MKNKKIYFLGIGGIGMSALAQYFLSEQAEVFGYDLTPSPITELLTTKGAHIHFEDNNQLIPEDIDFVVYTPAVPQTNQEFRYFVEHHIPMFKRAQVLGEITRKLPTIAVAGTHGKTTTTSLVSHLLAPEISIAAFIGGIAKNFNDNLVLGKNPIIAVAEADEFDRSFLTLSPAVAIITSMDADHLDIYGTRENLVAAFNQFANQAKVLIVEEHIAHEISHPNKIIYGTQSNADYYAHRIQYAPNCTTFDLHTPDRNFNALQLHANGIYNALNATAAIAAIQEIAKQQNSVNQHLTEDYFSNKLQTFSGVKRRFDYIIQRDDLIYIDDYAHHPEEMRSFITAVRKIYPTKTLCGVFQPHLYSRTRDFAEQFAEVLSLLDEIILLPIYPAREKPIPGINAEYLLSLIKNNHKVVVQKEELIPYLQKRQPEILLTIGAGDIDRFVQKISTTL